MRGRCEKGVGMTAVTDDRIREILRLLQTVRADLAEGTPRERLKVIEKALLQLDAELDAARRKGR